MKELQHDFLSLRNVIQGTLWRSKVATEFGEKFVLPLYVYFDDYEVGNPLGSHAGLNKIGAVYLSIACLPPKRASSIKKYFFSLTVPF